MSSTLTAAFTGVAILALSEVEMAARIDVAVRGMLLTEIAAAMGVEVRTKF
jgi:hypothetical protein